MASSYTLRLRPELVLFAASAHGEAAAVARRVLEEVILPPDAVLFGQRQGPDAHETKEQPDFEPQATPMKSKQPRQRRC